MSRSSKSVQQPNKWVKHMCSAHSTRKMLRISLAAYPQRYALRSPGCHCQGSE